MEKIQKISLENAEHYKWADDCDGWHLLKHDDLSIIRERMGPHTAEQRHFHHHAQQLFYILSGEASFDIGTETIRLNPGESVHIPANTVHRISNKTNEELHFIVTSAPRAHGDRENV